VRRLVVFAVYVASTRGGSYRRTDVSSAANSTISSEGLLSLKWGKLTGGSRVFAICAAQSRRHERRQLVRVCDQALEPYYPIPVDMARVRKGLQLCCDFHALSPMNESQITRP
jgi:hypothetical protein